MKNSLQKEENKKRINNIKNQLAFIFAYGRKYLGMLVIYTLCGMTGVVVSLFGSLVSRDLVDIVTGRKTGELIKYFVLMIATVLFTVLINNVSSYIGLIISTRIENRIKEDIYEKIMTSKWEDLSEYHSGNLATRWTSDSAMVVNGLLNGFSNTIIMGFRLVSSFWLVIRNDASFAIFAFVSVPISYLISRRNMKRMRKASNDTMEATTKMSTFIQDSFSDIQSVKAFDMVKMYINQLKDVQKGNTDARLHMQRVSIVNSIILTLVSSLVTYSTYGWGVYRVWSGAITYGSMTMFISLSSSLTATLQGLIGVVPTLINSTNAAQRIMDISNLPKEDYSKEEEIAQLLKETPYSEISIEVDEVSFAYKNGTEVYKKATFEAHPREIIGIIGPSGEGKTTLLRLLLALVDPQKGKITIKTNWAEHEEYDMTASVRQLISYVPQGNTMFSGTIAENMRKIKPDVTDDEIIAALDKACAWEFVKKLPDGINTEIKERGGGLSEGQSQRLSISRAFLRKSPILYLDEATSALDMDTASRVMDNVLSDDYPRTCIISTHRPEVMELCDKVYKITEGELVLCDKEECVRSNRKLK